MSIEPAKMEGRGAKAEVYAGLLSQLGAVFEGEKELISNMANCAALLYHTLEDLNWAGFYLSRGEDLVLGPFQGQPACVRIPRGKGVCGAAAFKRQTIVVADVREFPGHIACDAASRSEIVVPLIAGSRLVGVLDLDSPIVNRFDAADQAGLEPIARRLLDGSELGM